MAQLLSVRSLTSDSPEDLNSLNSYIPPPDYPIRCESADNLVQDDRLQQTDKELNSFQNPVFQCDETPSERGLPTSVSANRTTFENSAIQFQSLKRSLSPSDSGIHIPEDITSIKSGKSLDSGLDEPRIPSSNDTKVTIPPGDDKPPLQNGTSRNKKLDDEKEESFIAICIQVFFPFIIAGIGTCGAGLVLDYVEKWEVFTQVTELFILVPTLLGLKGNLEMTLASRVSTQANLGQLETMSEKWSMSWGNMALVQCQATVLALVSSAFATAISTSTQGFDISRALLLGSSALFTASIASLLLGAITLGVVLLSQRFNINPDNVATPIAASLGDITTLGILAAIASYLHQMRGNLLPSSLCVGVFVLLIPLWLLMSYRNPFVKQVLFSGWVPVILAVIITSIGGYILEFSVSQFKGFAIFQPVINGVAGNLVAVQASRISTYFHKHAEPGSRPPDGTNLCVSPFTSFFGRTPHARTARILLAMVVPGHLLFGYTISWIKGGDTALTLTFLPIYLAAALIQVSLLLYIAQCLIHVLWRWKFDPDNWAIPLLTALGDLSGMAALTSAFFLHRAITTP